MYFRGLEFLKIIFWELEVSGNMEVGACRFWKLRLEV